MGAAPLEDEEEEEEEEEEPASGCSRVEGEDGGEGYDEASGLGTRLGLRGGYTTHSFPTASER